MDIKPHLKIAFKWLLSFIKDIVPVIISFCSLYIAYVVLKSSQKLEETQEQLQRADIVEKSFKYLIDPDTNQKKYAYCLLRLSGNKQIGDSFAKLFNDTKFANEILNSDSLILSQFGPIRTFSSQGKIETEEYFDKKNQPYGLKMYKAEHIVPKYLGQIHKLKDYLIEQGAGVNNLIRTNRNASLYWANKNVSHFSYSILVDSNFLNEMKEYDMLFDSIYFHYRDTSNLRKAITKFKTETASLISQLIVFKKNHPQLLNDFFNYYKEENVSLRNNSGYELILSDANKFNELIVKVQPYYFEAWHDLTDSLVDIW